MTIKNHLAEYGKTLAQNGFDIVPLLPEAKNPVLKGWSKVTATKKELQRWLDSGYTGVGILTANTPVADLDIADQEIAKIMWDYCVNRFGETVMRIGNLPRVGLIFRTDEPFKKMVSTKYIDDNGEFAQVEILGAGQQMAALGVHPGTKEEYYYVDTNGGVLESGDPFNSGTHILDTKYDDLVSITVDEAKEIIDYFESIVPIWWEVKKKNKATARLKAPLDPDDDSFMMNHTPPLDIPDMRVAKALEFIDADDYDNLVTIGAALWHQYNGGKFGFDLWEAWAKTSPRYDPKGRADKWDSFEHDGIDRPTTFATALLMASEGTHNEIKEVRSLYRENHKAVEKAKEDEPVCLYDQISDGDKLVDEFLDRYIYIETDARVYDAWTQSFISTIEYAKFQLAQANRRTEIPDPIKSDPDRVKVVTVAPIWLADVHRKTVRGMNYFPEKKLIYKENNVGYINTFYFPVDNTGIKLKL